jgi:hypothetical protein
MHINPETENIIHLYGCYAQLDTSNLKELTPARSHYYRLEHELLTQRVSKIML